MKVVKYPNRDSWPSLLKRPLMRDIGIERVVQSIINDVKAEGDQAIRRHSINIDKVDLEDFRVSDEEIKNAGGVIKDNVKKAIAVAKKNIEEFHSKQLVNEGFVETMPGVKCWRKNVAIEKVGLYIPGGTAPLFSTVLMLGVPAKIAGCRQVILCSPPSKEGTVHPAILYTADFVGITQIYKIGGAQAIAAMAYGTETIPKVDKILGPGNQYVTIAKLLVQKDGVAIDFPAGPSELAIYADDTAIPSFLAADLLSQAEHGEDSQVMLVTTHSMLIDEVLKELDKQLIELPRKDIAIKALENSYIILLKNESQVMEMLNEYAPEHLILACSQADNLSKEILNAGSVFIGNYSPEPVGDYASGTNHTLPTNGLAKAYGGVSVESFVKKISFQHLTKEGLRAIAETVRVMSEAEGLQAHAAAIRIRIRGLKDDQD